MRLSVWAHEDGVVGCKSPNMVTGGVRTNSWGAKLSCGVQLTNSHVDIASTGDSDTLHLSPK